MKIQNINIFTVSEDDVRGTVTVQSEGTELRVNLSNKVCNMLLNKLLEANAIRNVCDTVAYHNNKTNS